MAVIALDLGGTKLAAALFDPAGTVIHKNVGLLEQRQGKEVGALIVDMTERVQHAAKASGARVDAVGICVPGISYSKSGRVWAPNIPGWEDYPLLQEMQTALHSKTTRVSIDSDRACSILGEVWQGAAKGCRDAIFLAVGTGIGAGILADGRILRGADDIAGAIGWSALDRPFVQKYASCGCFEYHASGEGLAKVAREYLATDREYKGVFSSRGESAITARGLFDAWDQHDPLASLFNPEKIIFGGGVFGPAVRFLDAIMAEARKWAQPISITRVRLEGSLLGSDAGMYGAAFLALQTLLSHPS
jgi:glucokinase